MAHRIAPVGKVLALACCVATAALVFQGYGDNLPLAAWAHGGVARRGGQESTFSGSVECGRHAAEGLRLETALGLEQPSLELLAATEAEPPAPASNASEAAAQPERPPQGRGSLRPAGEPLTPAIERLIADGRYAEAAAALRGHPFSVPNDADRAARGGVAPEPDPSDVRIVADDRLRIVIAEREGDGRNGSAEVWFFDAGGRRLAHIDLTVEHGSYEGARPLEAVRQEDGRIVALVHSARLTGTDVSVGIMRAVLVPAPRGADAAGGGEPSRRADVEWLKPVRLILGHTHGYIGEWLGSIPTAAVFPVGERGENATLCVSIGYELRAERGLLFVRQRGVAWLCKDGDEEVDSVPADRRRTIESVLYVDPDDGFVRPAL